MSRKTVRHYSGDLKYPEPVFKSVDFLWVSLQTNILHRTFFTLWAIPYLKKNWSFTLFSSSASNLNKMIWWNLPSAVEIVFKRKLRSALCYRFFGWFLLRERRCKLCDMHQLTIHKCSVSILFHYHDSRRDNAIFAYFKWQFSNKKRSTLEKMQVFLAVHFAIDPLSKMCIWYWANTRKHKDTTRITFNQ